MTTPMSLALHMPANPMLCLAILGDHEASKAIYWCFGCNHVLLLLLLLAVFSSFCHHCAVLRWLLPVASVFVQQFDKSATNPLHVATLSTCYSLIVCEIYSHVATASHIRCIRWSALLLLFVAFGSAAHWTVTDTRRTACQQKHLRFCDSVKFI